MLAITRRCLSPILQHPAGAGRAWNLQNVFSSGLSAKSMLRGNYHVTDVGRAV